MRRLLLTVCVALAATPLALAQSGDPVAIPPTVPAPSAAPTQASPPAPPAARLIKPRQYRGELRTGERIRPRPPVDDRCRALKQELEGELARPGNPRRTFQARLAHNAGTRLCRDGQVEKGMAEFRKGLSYLEETHHP